ncbi:MAG: DUF1080 domain-containing protein, partial [Patescibacteria group bacterium]|nr:DUF1080 domain-containing protein [Patescibacteria group bacterium]
EVGYNNFDFSKFQTLKVELINEGGNTRVKTYIDGYRDTNYIQSTSTISGLVSGRIGLATRNMKERVWFNNTGIADEELFSGQMSSPTIDGFTPRDGSWVFEDGKLKQTARYSSATNLDEYDAIVMDGYDFSSGTIDVDITLDKDDWVSSSDPAACVGFRMDANGNGYMVYVDKSYLRLYRVYGGFVSLENLTSVSFDAALTYGQKYSLHIEANDKVLSASINGKTITRDTKNDSVKHASGDIWMMTMYNSGSRTPITFENIYVDNQYPEEAEDFTAFKKIEHVVGAWSIDDSFYKQTETSAQTMALLNDYSLKDGYLSTQVRLTGTTTSEEAVLFFRVSNDLSSGYAAKIRRTGTTGARVNLYSFTGGINGTYTSVGTTNVDVNDINMNQWNDFEVEFRGSDINVYVNGVRYIKASSSTILTPGRAGMGTAGTSAPVYFDTIRSEGSLLYEDFQPESGEALPTGFNLEGYGRAIVQNEISTTWYGVDLLISLPIGQGTVSGTLNGVDLVNNTLDLGDLKVTYNSSTTIRLNGSSYTAEALKAKLNELQLAGYVIRLTNTETVNKYPNDKWIFEDGDCEFTSEIPSEEIQVGSILNAVNAVGNTVTIGGQLINLTGVTNIRLYDVYGAYITVTASELLAKLVAVQGQGRKIETYYYDQDVEHTTAGWKFTSNTVYFRVVAPQVNIATGAVLDDVNAASNTVTINGRAIRMREDGCTVQWYDGSNYTEITLAALKTRLDQAAANGMAVETYYYDWDIYDKEGQWVSIESTVRFKLVSVTMNVNTGSLLEGVDNVNRKITIGGQVINLSEDKTIRWYTGSSYETIDIATLKTRLAEMVAGGSHVELYSSVGITQDTSSAWGLTSSYISFVISSVAPQFNSGSIIEAVNSVSGTVTIAGQVIRMPSSSYTIQWYNGSSYEAITLAELNSRITQAKANGLESQVYNYSLYTQSTQQGLQFTSTTLYFSLVDIGGYITAGSLVTGVDATGGTVTIGGDVVRMPSSYTIQWYTGDSAYETITIATLASRLAAAEASGDMVEVYSSNLDTMMNFNGWQFRTTTLKFRTAKSTSQLMPGSLVESLNTTTRVVTIGGQAMTIPASGCTIRWYDGSQYQTVTVEQLNTKIQEAHAAGHDVEVYSSNIAVWNTSSGYAISSSTINFRVAESSATISANSIVGGINAVGKTITVGGKVLHIDSATTTIQWYNGSAYTTIDIDTLATKIAAVEAAGGKVKITYSDVAVRNRFDGSGWLVTSSQIRLSNNLGSLTAQPGSKIEAVDATNKTITVAGRTIAMPSSFTVYWYDGSSYTTITLSELSTRLSSAQSSGNGMELFNYNQAAVETDSGWVFTGSTFYFTEPIPTGTIYSGSLLDSVDVSGGTFNIGGQTIKVPSSSYTVQWSDGATTTTISLTVLAQKLAAAAAAGRTVRINNNYSIKWEVDAWRFTSTTLVFSDSYGQSTVRTGSLLDSVDTDALTFDINGQTIKLSPSYTIQWNNGYQTSTIDITQLATYLAQADSQGRRVELTYDFTVYGLGSDWVTYNGSTLRFRIAAGTATLNSGSMLENVNLTDSCLTIGGQFVYLPASGCTLKWKTTSGVTTVTASELKTKLAEAEAAGVPVSTYTSAGISYIDGKWMVTSSELQFSEISGTAVLKTDSVLTDVDVDAGTVTIGGRTYTFATGVKPYFYCGPYYYNFSERTLAELDTLLSEATAAGKIIEVNYNNSNIAYENGNWVLTGHLYLNHDTSPTMYVYPGSLLEGVDTSGGTLTIGGNTMSLPSTYYIRWYYGSGYEEISLTELATRLANSKAAGDMVEVYSNALDYVMSGETMQITETYLYFRGLSGYSSYTSGSVIGGVNEADSEVTIGGDTLHIDNSRTEIRWYDGSTYEVVTMAQLATLIADAETAGNIVQLSGSCNVWRSNGEWSVADTYISIGIRRCTAYAYTESLLSGVDATARTLTIGGQTYSVPDTYSSNIYWYNETGSAQSISLSELETKVAEAQAAGNTVEVYNYSVSVYLDGGGFVVNNSTMGFRVSNAYSRITSGSKIEGVDLDNNKITIGGEEYELPTSFTFYWYENGSSSSMTSAQFLQKFNEAQAAGTEIEVPYSDVDYVISNGVRKLTDSYMYVGDAMPTARLDSGTLVSAADPSGNTITTGFGTITLQSNATIYWQEPGQSNVSITLSELAAKIAAEEAKGNTVQISSNLYLINKSGTWTHSYGTVYVGPATMSRTLNSGSVLESVDAANGTLNMGGDDIKVASGCTLQIYDNSSWTTVSLEQLAAKLSQYASEGKTLKLYYGETLSVVDGYSGYTAASNLRFSPSVYEAVSEYFTYGTLLGSVNTTERTVNMGGQTVKVPEGATLRYYNGIAYETVTIEDLAARLAADTAAGDTVELYTSIYYSDKDGTLEFSSGTITFAKTSSLSYAYMGGGLDSVNATGKTVTIGGTTVKLPDTVKVFLDGTETTLAGLSTYLASHNVATGASYSYDKRMFVRYTGGVWQYTGDVLELHTTVSKEAVFGDSFSGRITAVNAVSRQITVNGTVITVPAGFKVYADGQELTLTQLEALLASNTADGALTWFESTRIERTAGVWNATSTSSSVNINTKKNNQYVSGTLTGADSSAGTISMGGKDIHVPAGTLFFFDGHAVTFAEFEALLEDNIAGGVYTDLYSSRNTKLVGGAWVLDGTGSLSVSAVSRTVTYRIDGNITSFNNTTRMLSIDGNDVYVPDTGAITIYFNGEIIDPSDLASLITASQDMDVPVRIESGEFRTCPDGSMAITSSAVYFRTMSDVKTYYTAKVESVSVANNTITAGGITIEVPKHYTFYLNGQTYTMSEIEQLLAGQAGQDAELWISSAYVCNTPDGWKMYSASSSRVTFNYKGSRETYFYGKVGDIDLAGGTVTAGDKEILLTGRYYLDGVYVSGDAVLAWKDAIEAQGGELWVSGQHLELTPDGWTSTDGYVRFTTKSVRLSSVYGMAESVDTANSTVTVDGMTVNIPSNYTISCDGTTVSLEMLAAIIAANEAAGGYTRLESATMIMGADGKWKPTSTTVNFKTMTASSSSFYGKITSVSAGENTITVNGNVVHVPAAATFTLDGVAIALADLPAAIEQAHTTTEAEIWLNGDNLMYKDGAWYITDTSIDLLTKKGEISNMAGALDSVDVSGGKVSINGVDILLGGRSITIDGRTVTASELNAVLAANAAMGAVTWLNSASNNVRFVGDGYTFVSDLTFVTYFSSMDSFNGLVSGIDAGAGTITVNGITINIPQGKTFSMDGRTLTLADMEAIFTQNETEGMQTGISSFSLTYNSTGWQVTSSSLSFFTQYNRQASFNGSVSQVNAAGKTITVDGKVVTVKDGTTVRFNGVTVTLTELAQKLSGTISAGGLVWLENSNIVATADGWKFSDSTVNFSTHMNYQTSFVGGITGVDDTAGTITIDGKQIKVMAGSTITVNGVGLTLSDLKTAWTAIEADGAILWLGSTTIRETADGWGFTGNITFTTRMNNQYISGGTISAVNTTNNTITLGGYVIKVEPGITLNLDSVAVSLADLKTLCDANIAAGFTTRADTAYIRRDASGWIFDKNQTSSVSFLSKSSSQYNFCGVLTGVNTTSSLLTVNGTQLNVAGRTFTLDGTTVSVGQLLDAMSAATANGMLIWLNNANLVKTRDGQWTQSSSSSYYNFAFETRSAQSTSFQGAVTAVDSVARTITIDGNLVKVPVSCKVKLDGREVTLEELAATDHAWMLSTTMKYTSDGWMFTASEVQFQTNYNIQSSFQGRLNSVNITDNKVVIDGMNVNLGNVTTVRVDGTTVLLSQLPNILSAAAASGCILWLSATSMAATEAGFFFKGTTLDFTTVKSAQTSYRGLLDSVDVTGRYLEVNGRSIYVPENTTVQLNSVTVTLDILQTALATAAAETAAIMLSSTNVKETAAGWTFTAGTTISFNITKGTINSFGGEIASVDAANRKITVNGITVKLSSDSVGFDGQTITLAELATRLAENNANGALTWLGGLSITYTRDGWSYTNTWSNPSITTKRLDCSSASGTLTAVDTVNKTITINGITIKVPDSGVTMSVDGVSITLEQLASILPLNTAVDVLTSVSSVSFRISGGELKLVSTSLSFTSKRMTAPTITGNATSVDQTGGNVVINGETIHLEDGVKLYVDGTELTLAQFAQRVADNVAAGYGIWLASTSYIQFTYRNGVFTAAKTSTYDCTLNFVTQEGHFDDYKGYLYSVNAGGNTFNVNGLTFTLPADCAILMDGKTVDLAGLHALLLANQAVGRKTLFKTVDIHKEAAGWVPETTVIEFSTMGAYTILSKALVTDVLTSPSGDYVLIEIDGMNVRITDDTVIASGATKEDFAAALRSNVDQGYFSIVDVTLSNYGSTEWVAVSIDIATTTSVLGHERFNNIRTKAMEMTMTGDHAAVIEYSGREYEVTAETVITDIEGKTLSVAEFRNLMQINDGLYVDLNVFRTSSGLFIGNITIVLDLGTVFSQTGRLESIDVPGGSITVDGTSYTLSADTIIVDNNGDLLTISELQDVMSSNDLYSAETYLGITSTILPDGSVLAVTLNVLTPDSRQAQYSIDVVDGVDDAAGTMDIAGTTYEVAAGAVIRNSKGTIITLAALAGILVYNDSTGVPTYAKIHQDFDGTTWR